MRRSFGFLSAAVPYPARRRGHACPTLRSARAAASRIPLGCGPFLRRLRRSVRSLVRRHRRYYGLIRLLRTVHHRLRIPPFPMRPRHDRQGSSKTSQGPDRRRANVHGVSDTAGPACLSPKRDRRCGLRPFRKSRRPGSLSFRCSIALPAHTAADASPAPSRAQTHGSRRNVDRLLLRSRGLPPPTFRQFAWHTKT